ncbi:MAG: UDP-N-acetylmuramate dehydrogenase [Terracidiphilus sp.]
MQITENQPLAPFTTLEIGGPARWFAEARSEDDIAEACEWARGRDVPLFVLGGGSNVLVSDRGFPGLVLHIGLMGTSWDGEVLRAAAGEPWDNCVQQAIERDCAGMECLAGIPGTVGGTPVQNVGAYGQEVASVIERVRAFDIGAQTFIELSAAECEFSYRRSRFNTKDRGRFIVTRVDYGLRPNGPPNLTYADLKSHFQNRPDTPSLREVADAVREIRRSKGMLMVEGDPDCRSVGSFFKNPAVSQDVADKIRWHAEEAGVPLRVFPADGGLVKIPAAWLIEHAGFAKGYAFGAAGISPQHTLALVNRGGALADEILSLAQKIADAVEAKFGVRLEMEPEKIGF